MMLETDANKRCSVDDVLMTEFVQEYLRTDFLEDFPGNGEIRDLIEEFEMNKNYSERYTPKRLENHPKYKLYPKSKKHRKAPKDEPEEETRKMMKQMREEFEQRFKRNKKKVFKKKKPEWLKKETKSSVKVENELEKREEVKMMLEEVMKQKKKVQERERLGMKQIKEKKISFKRKKASVRVVNEVEEVFMELEEQKVVEPKVVRVPKKRLKSRKEIKREKEEVAEVVDQVEELVQKIGNLEKKKKVEKIEKVEKSKKKSDKTKNQKPREVSSVPVENVEKVVKKVTKQIANDIDSKNQVLPKSENQPEKKETVNKEKNKKQIAEKAQPQKIAKASQETLDEEEQKNEKPQIDEQEEISPKTQKSKKGRKLFSMGLMGKQKPKQVVLKSFKGESMKSLAAQTISELSCGSINEEFAQLVQESIDHPRHPFKRVKSQTTFSQMYKPSKMVKRSSSQEKTIDSFFIFQGVKLIETEKTILRSKDTLKNRLILKLETRNQIRDYLYTRRVFGRIGPIKPRKGKVEEIDNFAGRFHSQMVQVVGKMLEEDWEYELDKLEVQKEIIRKFEEERKALEREARILEREVKKKEREERLLREKEEEEKKRRLAEEEEQKQKEQESETLNEEKEESMEENIEEAQISNTNKETNLEDEEKEKIIEGVNEIENENKENVEVKMESKRNIQVEKIEENQGQKRDLISEVNQNFEQKEEVVKNTQNSKRSIDHYPNMEEYLLKKKQKLNKWLVKETDKKEEKDESDTTNTNIGFKEDKEKIIQKRERLSKTSDKQNKQLERSVELDMPEYDDLKIENVVDSGLEKNSANSYRKKSIPNKKKKLTQSVFVVKKSDSILSFGEQSQAFTESNKFIEDGFSKQTESNIFLERDESVEKESISSIKQGVVRRKKKVKQSAPGKAKKASKKSSQINAKKEKKNYKLIDKVRNKKALEIYYKPKITAKQRLEKKKAQKNKYTFRLRKQKTKKEKVTKSSIDPAETMELGYESDNVKLQMSELPPVNDFQSNQDLNLSTSLIREFSPGIQMDSRQRLRDQRDKFKVHKNKSKSSVINDHFDDFPVLSSSKRRNRNQMQMETGRGYQDHKGNFSKKLLKTVDLGNVDFQKDTLIENKTLTKDERLNMSNFSDFVNKFSLLNKSNKKKERNQESKYADIYANGGSEYPQKPMRKKRSPEKSMPMYHPMPQSFQKPYMRSKSQNRVGAISKSPSRRPNPEEPSHPYNQYKPMKSNQSMSKYDYILDRRKKLAKKSVVKNPKKQVPHKELTLDEKQQKFHEEFYTLKSRDNYQKPRRRDNYENARPSHERFGEGTGTKKSTLKRELAELNETKNQIIEDTEQVLGSEVISLLMGEVSFSYQRAKKVTLKDLRRINQNLFNNFNVEQRKMLPVLYKLMDVEMSILIKSKSPGYY